MNKKRRNKPQRLSLEQRFYYTRREVCQRFGFSDPRLKELITHDNTLPMVRNGRNQLFPKDAMQAWFEAAAAKRLNVLDL